MAQTRFTDLSGERVVFWGAEIVCSRQKKRYHIGSVFVLYRIMIATRAIDYLAPEVYLAQEQDSPIKHEYRNGEVYAMAGASDAHVTLALNMATQLRNHVRGSGCRVYMSDMKAQIDAANCYYYPDILVTCDERDRDSQGEHKYKKKHPCLIVEVLSPGTEAFDRGDKFFDYQKLASLQEYVLISQTQKRVDYFRRDPSGLWILQYFTPGDEIHLRHLDFKISFDALYEDVIFESNSASEPSNEANVEPDC